MSFDNHPNLVYSTVTVAPSPAASGTTLEVNNPSRFPDPAVVGAYNTTVWPNGDYPTTDNSEIVRITAKSGSQLTITRTQESTSARTIIVGDSIAVTVTQKIITDLETQLVEVAGDTMTGDLIGKSFVSTRNGTITRDGDGLISSVALTGGRTLTLTRDANDAISSITDGTRTWTITRDGDGLISSWAVT